MGLGLLASRPTPQPGGPWTALPYGLLFLDLSGMGGSTKSLCSRQHSSPGNANLSTIRP
jgi:hypothetical protein